MDMEDSTQDHLDHQMMEQYESSEYCDESEEYSDEDDDEEMMLLQLKKMEEDEVEQLQLQQQQQQQQEEEQEQPEDPSMVITPEERAFALQIKEAVEKGEFADQFQPLSDFEYAQWSIVTKGNLQDALKRIHGMQVFEQEYGITRSVDQAMKVYEEHFQQFPGYVLQIDVDPETHEPIIVLDLGSFYPNRTLAKPRQAGKHPDFNWKIDAIRNYYQQYIVTPSFSAIRQGLFCIIDCKDIGWDNFTMEYSQRLNSELWGHHPVLFKNLLCYNTGTVANVCWNMIKHLMDSNMRDKLQLGCQLAQDEQEEPQRLADLYIQPTMEAAQEKIVHRVAQLIELRNHNQSTFRL